MAGRGELRVGAHRIYSAGMAINAEYVLKWFLRCMGAVSALAVIAAVMPLSWMDRTHQWLGMGPLPEGPVVAYLARSTSGAYAVFAVFLILFSLDPQRYLLLIRASAWSMVGAGLGLGLFHRTSNMPVFWQRGEPLACALIGAVILFLAWNYARERGESGH